MAAAGVGFGLTNLISTFFQAGRRFRRASSVLLVAAGVQVAALVVAATLGGPLTLAYTDLLCAMATAILLWHSDADRAPMTSRLAPALPVWLACAAVAATQALPAVWLLAVAVLAAVTIRSRTSVHLGRVAEPQPTPGGTRRGGQGALHG